MLCSAELPPADGNTVVLFSGFSCLAQQHKREAPLIMQSKGLWHAFSFFLSLSFPPRVSSAPSLLKNTTRMLRLCLIQIQTAKREWEDRQWSTPTWDRCGQRAPTPLCTWFSAGQRQFAEAGICFTWARVRHLHSTVHAAVEKINEVAIEFSYTWLYTETLIATSWRNLSDTFCVVVDCSLIYYDHE